MEKNGVPNPDPDPPPCLVKVFIRNNFELPVKVLHLAENSLVIFILCEVAGHNGEVNGLQGEHRVGQLLLFFTSCQGQLLNGRDESKGSKGV